MYVKITNGQPSQFPYTIEQLLRDNLNTSFPKQISNEILADYNVYNVTQLDKPSYDYLVQTIVRGDPVLNNGEWEVGYTIQNKSQEEAEINVRLERDSFLQETDWTALSDVTMSSDMTTYRQALRDVPAQEGFPFNVTWPTKPE